MSADGVETLQRGGAHSAALTVVAMCLVGALVFWWARPEDSAAPGATATISAGLSAANGAYPPSRPAKSPPAQSLAFARTAAPARHDPNAEPHETTPSRPQEFPVHDAAASPEVQSGPAETTDVDPATARAAAIREAGQQGGGAAELAQLVQSLRSDALARNRLLAIKGLRELAADPALKPQVLDALRVAQDDRDANVSRNARDAYVEFADP